MKRKLIAITAGGTAGHLFPAEVLAHKIDSEQYDIVFLGDKKSANFAPSLEIHSRKVIQASGISHKSRLNQITSLLRIAFGTGQSLLLFIVKRPMVIVGFGSYASVPALLAARLLKIPYIIHEQNAVLGRANRLALAKARKVALSFPHTRHAEDEDKCQFIGNLVRSEFKPTLYAAHKENGKFRILITGGSQGARFFGETIPQAFAILPKELRKRLEITHQVRAEQLQHAKSIYDGAGISASISPFFDTMAQLLSKTHLLIGRSGASTIAEATTTARPMILIPLPNSVDDHQMINARFVSDKGGAYLLCQDDSLTAEVISNKIKDLMNNPKSLEQTAKHASNCFPRHADEALLAMVLEIINLGMKV